MFRSYEGLLIIFPFLNNKIECIDGSFPGGLLYGDCERESEEIESKLESSDTKHYEVYYQHAYSDEEDNVGSLRDDDIPDLDENLKDDDIPDLDENDERLSNDKNDEYIQEDNYHYDYSSDLDDYVYNPDDFNKNIQQYGSNVSDVGNQILPNIPNYEKKTLLNGVDEIYQINDFIKKNYITLKKYKVVENFDKCSCLKNICLVLNLGNYGSVEIRYILSSYHDCTNRDNGPHTLVSKFL